MDTPPTRLKLEWSGNRRFAGDRRRESPSSIPAGRLRAAGRLLTATICAEDCGMSHRTSGTRTLRALYIPPQPGYLGTGHCSCSPWTAQTDLRPVARPNTVSQRTSSSAAPHPEHDANRAASHQANFKSSETPGRIFHNPQPGYRIPPRAFSYPRQPVKFYKFRGTSS